MKASFHGMMGKPRRSAWMPPAFALLLLVCLSSAPALGQDYWQGAYGSNWLNAGNWNQGGLAVAPTAGANAVINGMAFSPVPIDAQPYSGVTASVANLTLQNPADAPTVLSGDALPSTTASCKGWERPIPSCATSSTSGVRWTRAPSGVRASFSAAARSGMGRTSWCSTPVTSC